MIVFKKVKIRSQQIQIKVTLMKLDNDWFITYEPEDYELVKEFAKYMNRNLINN